MFALLCALTFSDFYFRTQKVIFVSCHRVSESSHYVASPLIFSFARMLPTAILFLQYKDAKSNLIRFRAAI